MWLNIYRNSSVTFHILFIWFAVRTRRSVVCYMCGGCETPKAKLKITVMFINVLNGIGGFNQRFHPAKGQTQPDEVTTTKKIPQSQEKGTFLLVNAPVDV